MEEEKRLLDIVTWAPHYDNKSNPDSCAKISWEDIIQICSESKSLEKKEEGGSFSPVAVFIPADGIHPIRKQKNVESLSMWVLDIDDCDDPVAVMEEALPNTAWHMYTTFSNYTGAKGGRCRVIVPLSQNVDRDIWKDWYMSALDQFKIPAEIADDSVTDLCRIHYCPSHNKENKDKVFFHTNEGEFLDPKTVVVKPYHTSRNYSGGGSGIQFCFTDAFSPESYCQGNRHDTIRGAALSLANRGFTQEDTTTILDAIVQKVARDGGTDTNQDSGYFDCISSAYSVADTETSPIPTQPKDDEVSWAWAVRLASAIKAKRYSVDDIHFLVTAVAENATDLTTEEITSAVQKVIQREEADDFVDETDEDIMQHVETIVLAHMVSYKEAQNLMNNRGITVDHFKNDLHKQFFQWVKKYFIDGKGTLVTQNISPPKFIDIWEAINDVEVTFDELIAYLMVLKRRKQKEYRQKSIESINEGDYNEALVQTSLAKNEMETRSNDSLMLNNLADQIDEFIFNMKEKRNHKVKIGLPVVEEAAGGLYPGAFIVFSGTSGGGKSLIMTNTAINAWKTGSKVLYISLEMSADRMFTRIIPPVADIPFRDVNDMNLTEGQIERIKTTAKEMAEGLNYFIMECPIESPTPEKVEELIISTTAQHGKPDLVVVDYIGIMKSHTTRFRTKNEVDQVIIDKLRTMALEYGLVILSAQQQNRSSREKSKAKKIDVVGQDGIAGTIELVNATSWCGTILSSAASGTMVIVTNKGREGHPPPFYLEVDSQFRKVLPYNPNKQEDLECRWRMDLDGEIGDNMKQSDEKKKDTMTPYEELALTFTDNDIADDDLLGDWDL
jgi:archaellum biogenesis ATPase FlaH